MLFLRINQMEFYICKGMINNKPLIYRTYNYKKIVTYRFDRVVAL